MYGVMTAIHSFTHFSRSRYHVLLQEHRAMFHHSSIHLSLRVRVRVHDLIQLHLALFFAAGVTGEAQFISEEVKILVGHDGLWDRQILSLVFLSAVRYV